MDRIYDEDGKQWAFHEEKRIFDAHGGHPILWIWGRHLFDWNGAHIGYFEDGWLYDHDGHAVGHFEEASGGPGVADDLQKSGSPQSTANTPDAFPRRQKGFPPEPFEKGVAWSVLNGRGFFTSFVDADGQTKDDSDGCWRSVRDRTAANLGVADAAAPEPESGGLPEPVHDPEALAALNEAVAAYREAVAGHDEDTLVLARAKLASAAEDYATRSGVELS